MLTTACTVTNRYRWAPCTYVLPYEWVPMDHWQGLVHPTMETRHRQSASSRFYPERRRENWWLVLDGRNRRDLSPRLLQNIFDEIRPLVAHPLTSLSPKMNYPHRLARIQHRWTPVGPPIYWKYEKRTASAMRTVHEAETIPTNVCASRRNPMEYTNCCIVDAIPTHRLPHCK